MVGFQLVNGLAGLLIVTSVKMLSLSDAQMDPEKNVVLRLARRLWPVTARFHGEHFFVRAGSSAAAEPAYQLSYSSGVMTIARLRISAWPRPAGARRSRARPAAQGCGS